MPGQEIKMLVAVKKAARIGKSDGGNEMIRGRDRKAFASECVCELSGVWRASWVSSAVGSGPAFL
jgi:hypothetical protein